MIPIILRTKPYLNLNVVLELNFLSLETQFALTPSTSEQVQHGTIFQKKLKSSKLWKSSLTKSNKSKFHCMKCLSGGNLNSENLIFSETDYRKYKISFSDFGYFKFTQNDPSVFMNFSWNTKSWNVRKKENVRKCHKNVFPISENMNYREYAKRNTFLKSKICVKLTKTYFRFL